MSIVTIVSFLLGLRLALAGGRESVVRLVFTVVGIAVALAVLLLAFTAPTAAAGRAERVVWQDAAYAYDPRNLDPELGNGTLPTPESEDGALFLAVSDYHDGQPMVRAYVAALGPAAPVPPGLDRLPGPGEVAVSPALRRLIDALPADQLADRFPGRPVLTIGPAGLAHDNELVGIIGRTPAQLAGVGSVQEVYGFRDITPPGVAISGLQQAFLFIGAVVVLFPVVFLVITVSRVGAAQREQRLAAIRLAGATRAQVAAIAAAEIGLAAAGGSLLAWGLYEGGRRVAAETVVFQHGHFWLEDLVVPTPYLVGILLSAPALVMAIALMTLRLVHTSPLGTQRRSRRRPPSVWRALPLVVGIGGQVVLAATTDPESPEAPVAAVTLLSLLTVVGLVLFGPWLCWVLSRGVARLARQGTGLLAARRIAADPYSTFRSVSGVVLAATALAYIGTTRGTGQPADDAWVVAPRPGVVMVNTGLAPAETVAPLLGPGVVTERLGPFTIEADCAALARVVHNVACPFPADRGFTQPGASFERLPVTALYLRTDGSLAAENRVRTRVANVIPNAIINTDRDPVDNGDFAPYFADMDRLGAVAAFFVLVIGACGLTAGVIAGLIERRRPFALLRATGVRLSELRRVVVLETAATMVVTAALGVALGLFLAYATIRQGQAEFRWPEPLLYGYLGAGLLAALAFSTLALPLLDRVTSHDAIRYE